MSSLSLYLHIPFCSHRCSYCDFNTYTSLGHLQTAYAHALAAEIAQAAAGERRPVHTIFFGGGTPSLMTPAEMGIIFEALHDNFEIAPDAEISMECNPITISAEYLQAMRMLGVNRLSLGVQSVIANELRLLDRQHDFQTVVNAIDIVRAAGFDNFNIDLIYGVPGQTLASWRQSIEAVLALDPTHLSLYCLTIEPGTPMQRWLRNGTMSAPDGDLAADQFELAVELMGANGYEHYEISNWAKPNRQCEHNLTYWRNNDYLGLGAGAHGYANGVRYHIVKQPRRYIHSLTESSAESLHYPLTGAVADHSRLSAEEKIGDTVITQLRLLQEGLDCIQFEAQFGVSPNDHFGPALGQLIEWELVQKHGRYLQLTDQGQFVSNQVFSRLI